MKYISPSSNNLKRTLGYMTLVEVGLLAPDFCPFFSLLRDMGSSRLGLVSIIHLYFILFREVGPSRLVEHLFIYLPLSSHFFSLSFFLSLFLCHAQVSLKA
jgi:hypothetical protein